MVGCEISLRDCFDAAVGEAYFARFFFVVDFLLAEPTVLSNFWSDLYFLIVGLMKYSFSSYSSVSYFEPFEGFEGLDTFLACISCWFLLGCS